MKKTLEYLSSLQDVDKKLVFLEYSKGDLPKTVKKLKEDIDNIKSLIGNTEETLEGIGEEGVAHIADGGRKEDQAVGIVDTADVDRVLVVVDSITLDSGGHGSEVREDAPCFRARLRFEEVRYGDGRQDRDNRDDDQEFD